MEDSPLLFNATLTIDSPSDYPKLRYYWDFGDGSLGRGREIHHIYRESGNYTVKLIVLDDDGARSTIEKSVVVVNTPPTLELIEDYRLLEEGQTSIFRANSTDTLTDSARLIYTWSSGAKGWQTSQLWTDDGNATFSVIVQDPEGLSASASTTVLVRNVPPSIAPSMAFVAGNLTLRAAGTPNNTLELSIYENSLLRTQVSLDRIPGDPDSQAITIPFVFDLKSDWRIEVSYGTVTRGANPAWITFTFPDRQATTRLFHNFVVAQNTTWRWTITPARYYFSWPVTINGTIFDPGADGLTGEIRYNGVPILTFSRSADGTWPAELPFEVTIDPIPTSILEIFAIDDEGASASARIHLIDAGQLVVPDLSPRVAISAPRWTTENLTVEFTAIALGATLTEAFSYEWWFGDGTVARGAKVQHSFSTAGEYLVQLTATDHLGRRTTRGQLIHVANYQPQVEIRDLFESVEDYELEFSAQIYETSADKETLQYFWTLGDGTVAAGAEVKHAYAYSGTYTIYLQVMDDNGVIGTDSVTVVIHDEPPVVDGPYGFEALEGTTLIAQVAVHDSTADEPALQYRWVHEGKILEAPLFTVRGDDGSFNV
ncbi:MAG: PKD domain-containing protein, partial [Candidatus Helarchaeota archaeon]